MVCLFSIVLPHYTSLVTNPLSKQPSCFLQCAWMLKISMHYHKTQPLHCFIHIFLRRGINYLERAVIPHVKVKAVFFPEITRKVVKVCAHHCVWLPFMGQKCLHTKPMGSSISKRVEAKKIQEDGGGAKMQSLPPKWNHALSWTMWLMG